MACIYWIRSPHATDITKEGYVGYTGSELETRLASHKRAYRRYVQGKDAPCKKLYAAIKKLGGFDNVVVSVVLISTKEYCLDIEEKLRPEPNIGWNIRVGGDKQVMHLREITEDTKRRLAEVRKTWTMSDRTKKRMSDERKGTGNPMHGVRPWDMKILTPNQLETWASALTIYAEWKIREPIGMVKLSRYFPELHNWSIDSMIRKFKKGWIPENDKEWVDFHEQYTK